MTDNIITHNLIIHDIANTYTSVYELTIDPDLISKALESAYILRQMGLELESGIGAYDPSLSNVGPMGESIITDLAFLSVFDIHMYSPEIREITKVVEQYCEILSRTKLNVDLTFVTHHSALVWYEHGSQITAHNHFPYTFVGTVYLELAENASPIIFGKDYVIQPRVGMCLISPGNLHHAIPPTDGERIVLGINVQAVIK